MTLSYAWSYDPVFPEAVFADSTVGPVLAALGMRYEDSSNHVPAFTDPTTVAAMLRLDDTMRALLTSVPLSYAPHSLSQPGDALATRTAWVLDSLRPLAYAWQGPNMAIDTLRARITPIIETARHVVVRHALRGPDGTWMPDMTRLAPFFGTSPTPFTCLPVCGLWQEGTRCHGTTSTAPAPRMIPRPSHAPASPLRPYRLA